VVEKTVDVLAEVAGGGRALELGIGTGRIALPLAGRGVPVHGHPAYRPTARLESGPPGPRRQAGLEARRGAGGPTVRVSREAIATP
jgi:hypothetical protein